MKTVICLTNAGSIDRKAVDYAKNFCRRIHASIVSIEGYSAHNVFSAPQPTPLEFTTARNIQRNQLDFRNPVMEEEVFTEPSIRMQAIHSIARLAITKDADLLIAGLEKTFTYQDIIGHPLAELVKQAKCPALLVPENSKFKPINRILLVIDHEFTIEHRMELIADIARSFEAEIFLYQLNKPYEIGGSHPFYESSVDFYFTFPYPFIQFKEAETEYLPATIQHLVETTKADLLITVPDVETIFSSASIPDVSNYQVEASTLPIPLLVIDTQPRQPVESTGYPIE